MNCRTAYFISGLGADHRIFKYIQLPEDINIIHLHWLRPEREETLPAYAMRLAKGIDTAEPFILVGLSFGGMLATEIAKHYKPEHIILISSIPVSAELPRYFRLAATLRLHKIVPIGLIKTMARTKRYITGETGEDKKLLIQIIQESDPWFLRWAFGAILSWQNETTPASFTHIHGNRDEVLPSKYTHPTHVIPKAGHLMVITRPAEVNACINELFNGNGRP